MKRCRTALPVSPWDRIGPRMRPGLAQTYIGGPFVIRNNPIGAFFDQVRAFCSPLPQEENGDDGFLAADGMSTPEYTTFDQGQPASGGWFGDLDFGPPGPATGGSSCGPGTIWDGGINACVPSPGGSTPATSSPASARKALATAMASADCEGVRQVLDMARSSRGTRKGSAYASWQEIALRAKSWLARNGRRCG